MWGWAGLASCKIMQRGGASVRIVCLMFVQCTNMHEREETAGPVTRRRPRSAISASAVHDGVGVALACARPARRGMLLSGMWIALSPALLGPPDVVEEPVADVDAAGRVGRRRAPPSRPRTPAATGLVHGISEV